MQTLISKILQKFKDICCEEEQLKETEQKKLNFLMLRQLMHLCNKRFQKASYTILVIA